MSEPSEPVKAGSITWLQCNLVVAFCTSAFLSGCLTSVLAPILPDRLDALGAGPLMTGAIFGAYPFTNALVSLFVPRMIDQLGRKPLLVLGLGMEGALVVLFGTVKLHSKNEKTNLPQLFLYLVLRILTGVCEATQNAVLSLYATEEFEEQGSLASVMGWSESAGGLGYIVGPGAGVLLATMGNFGTPFVVLGVLFVAILPLIPLALKNTKPRGPTCAAARVEARLPLRAYLTFDVVNAGLGTFLMGASFGSLGPTLGDHLKKKLDLRKPWMLGVVYGIPAIVYGVACPIVGILTDKSGRYRKYMRFGYSLVAAAFFMMGPFPGLRHITPFLFNKPGNPAIWLWAVTAMVLFGIGGACGFIPTLPAMQRAASHLGPAALETVNSLYWAVYFSGEGTGPMLGSVFVRGLGAEWGYSGIGVLVVIYLETMRQFAKDAGPEAVGTGALEAEREAERARIEMVELAKKDDGGEASPEGGAGEGSVAGSEEESESARLLSTGPSPGSVHRARRAGARDAV